MTELAVSEFVVSDASPIRYLVEIGQHELLRELFGKISIPDIVAGELTAGRTPTAVREWVLAPPPWIQIISTRAENKNIDVLWSLHEGERRAILLALSLQPGLLLMDERAGTIEARRLGLTVVGTLSILDRCAAKGWINLSSAFEHLLQTNFRVPRQLIQDMLAADANRQRPQ